MNARIHLLVVAPLLLAPPTLSQQRANDPWLWSLEAAVPSPGGGLYDYFGTSAALDGDTVLIGASLASIGFERPGAAFVYVRSGSSWALEARLDPSDPLDEGRFGNTVALQGDTALIGAYHDDDLGVDSGSVYVFVRSAGVWSQAAKLTAPDGSADDEFGYSLALGGNTALIGAPWKDSAGPRAGSAYVFIGSGASWTLLQTLQASDASSDDYFGEAVTLDGTTAVIGAKGAQGVSSWAGAAYVFTKYGGAWHEQARLQASDGWQYDAFGSSVALDGDVAVIGATDDDDGGWTTGSVYLFERSGSSWSQIQKLVASDPVTKDKFGAFVALEEETLLVSASYHVYGGGPGGVYVFHYPKDRWVELEKHTRPADDYYGCCLALDGNRFVTGDRALDAGYAYFYTRPPESGFRYCFGDPGVDTPCPCDNDNDGSVPGSGCDNGIFASGAQLTGYGEPSVALDEVYLRTTHTEPYNSGLYFQGTLRVNGGAGVVFGDGLRCAGGQVVRLQVRFADGDGTTRTTIPLAARGGVNPGDIRWYQYWYRTVTVPPCGVWVNDFNTSNGFSITWTP